MRSYYTYIMAIVVVLFSCSGSDDFTGNSETNDPDSTEDTTPIVISAGLSRATPLLGYNQQGLLEPEVADSDFYGLLNATAPAMLRYPGGVESQYWDWQNGRIIDELNWVPNGGTLEDNYFLSQVPQPSNTLLNLKQKLEITGSEVLFCLNVTSRTLEDQLEMLQEAQTIGIPVNYIELGNELYLSDADYINKYPTARDYALEMNNWIAAIRDTFPNAKIGICGTGVSGNRPERQLSWNDALFDLITDVDAITMHPYPGSIAEGQPNFDLSLLPSILSGPFRRNELNYSGPPGNPTAGINAFPASWELWITEYNLFELATAQNELAVASTWTHGLFSGLLTLLPMQNDPATILLNHVSHSNLLSFGAIVAEYENTAEGPIRIGDWELSAHGIVHSLIFNAAKNANSLATINFSRNPVFFENNEVAYGSLVGVFFEGSGKRAIIFNLGNATQTLDVASLFPNGGSYASYTIAEGQHAKIKVNSEDLIIIDNSFTDTITIPPYGIVAIN